MTYLSPFRISAGLFALALLSLPLVAVASSCPTLERTLQRGTSGQDVRSFQTYLMDEGYLFAESVTGIFGPVTEDAVRQWQGDVRIIAKGDAATTGWGVVGPRSRAVIFETCQPGPRSKNSGSAATFTSSLLDVVNNGFSFGPTPTTTQPLPCVNSPKPTSVCASGWQSAGQSSCIRFWYCISPSPARY